MRRSDIHQYVDTKQAVIQQVELCTMKHTNFEDFCSDMQVVLSRLVEFGVVKSVIGGFYSHRHTVELCVGYEPGFVDQITILVNNPVLIASATKHFIQESSFTRLKNTHTPAKTTVKTFDPIKAYDQAMKGI
jgi:hypothetical protein